MKTRFYIVLIVLLSFTLANAQKSTMKAKVFAVNNLNVNPVSHMNASISNDINSDLNNLKELNTNNKVIARSSSDIRIFLNKERNVENIKLLFPKINKKIIA